MNSLTPNAPYAHFLQNNNQPFLQNDNQPVENQDPESTQNSEISLEEQRRAEEERRHNALRNLFASITFPQLPAYTFANEDDFADVETEAPS